MKIYFEKETYAEYIEYIFDDGTIDDELIFKNEYFKIELNHFSKNKKFIEEICDMVFSTYDKNEKYIRYDDEIKFVIYGDKMQILKWDSQFNNNITLNIFTDNEIYKFQKFIKDINLYINDKVEYSRAHMQDIIIE